jgi:hypothetical protein
MQNNASNDCIGCQIEKKCVITENKNKNRKISKTFFNTFELHLKHKKC